MAKRFFDTDKYKNHFIRSLKAPYKLLWDYILCDCNHAGIWIVDFEAAQLYLGKDIKLNEKDALCFFNADKTRIIPIDNGLKWFIVPFVEFQYGELNENNRAHNSVICMLRKYDLLDANLSIIQKEAPYKPLTTPIEGCKDKDKDKDKDNILWRNSFEEYMKLVVKAKEELLSDKEFIKNTCNYYPNIDIALSLDKAIYVYWGTEDAWNKQRRKKVININLKTALKKNIDKNIVYKNKFSKPKEVNEISSLHPELKIVDEEGSLSDGTFIKNGHRYYFSNRKGTSFSVPMDEEPKPSGDCWEYAYGTGWYEEID